MLEPQRYGTRYWVVRGCFGITTAGVVHLYADELTVTPGGVLIFVRYVDGNADDKEVLLAINAGNWGSVHQASTEDGKPLGVERWKGVL